MAGTTPPTDSHEHFQHAPDQTALERSLSRSLTKIEPYSNQILIACIVIAIAIVGGIVWYRSSESRQSAAWEEFYANRAPEDYVLLADKYPDAPVGYWSRLEAGKLFISEGLLQALTNRSASDAALKKAKDAYETLLNKSVPPEVRQEALYGLATCLEALSDGDTSPAVKAYEQLLTEFPESRHRLWAEERIAALKTKNAEDFYAWFRKQNPKPEDRPAPKDIPDIGSMLPELEIPSAPTSEEPGSTDEKSADDATTGKKAPEVPADAKMPAPSEKSAAPVPELPDPTSKSEKPAGEKSATEKPEEKPADKPAATAAEKQKPSEKPAVKTESKDDGKPASQAPKTEKPDTGNSASGPESKPANPEKESAADGDAAK